MPLSFKTFKGSIVSILIGIASVATPCRAQVFWSSVSSSGTTDDVSAVTYANAIFAAVTNQGKILTSSDGFTWSSQTIAQGTPLLSIAFGLNTWVVVGANGTLLTSSDLHSWTSAKSGTSNTLNNVAVYGLFVAVGDAGSIISSSDAKTWTLQPSGITSSLYCTALIPGYSGRIVTPAALICGGQNGIVLDGTADATAFNPVQRSGTAQVLEAVTNQFNRPGYDTTVAVGTNGTIIYDNTSNLITGFDDNWQNATTLPGTSAAFRGLTYGSGNFVAVGDQGAIFSSTDGVSWTQRLPGDSPLTLSTSNLLGATFSDALQRFVAVGTSGTILVSSAPLTAFVNVSTRGVVSNSQNLIGGFVIQGTASRTILIRADGPSLTAFGVSNALADPVLRVYDGNQNLVATNSGWSTNSNKASLSAAAAKVGAFPLQASSADSADLLTLSPGAYTVVITSASGGSGVALFEAYSD
jgi:hypothetical protein